MLQRLISPFVGLLFILTMSACSSEAPSIKPSDRQTAVPGTAQTEAVETNTLSPDEDFIAQLHEAMPGTKKGNEADYIRLAKEFCGFMEDGYTPQGIVLSWINNGGTEVAANNMLKIATPIYCPQHSKVVEKNIS